MNTTELGNSTKNKFADFSDTEDFHGGEATACGGRLAPEQKEEENILIEKINSVVWGTGTLILLLGTGLFFSVKTRFFQLTHSKEIRRNFLSMFSDRNEQNGKHTISSFETLSATLSATMGTGNIVGVAVAISIGGAGSVFWIWVSAILGMMTVYAENYLGSKYRFKNDNGEWTGGAIAYISRGTGLEWLAVLFAVFCVMASFGMGNMTQSNTLSTALYSTFKIPLWLSGLVAAVTVFLITVGGIKSVGKATSFIIPPLSLIYMLAGIAVIIINYKNIGSAFAEIFSQAFGFREIGGGICGTFAMKSINIGLRRGVFSNEAGLGSSGILHSASGNNSPVSQGMQGISEVCIDTIFCCTLTALAILTSGADKLDLNALETVVYAFESCFGGFSGIFVAISTVLFAFATLLGWFCCGETCFRYIFGSKNTFIYKVLFALCVFIGAVIRLETAWTVSDIFNGLMAVPNLLALIILSPEVKTS